MEYYVDNYLKDFVSATAAIQSAIIECSRNGGGRVIFQKNKVYRAGFIELYDDVELFFEENAKLMASDNIEDFSLSTHFKEKLVTTPTWENCEYGGLPNQFFIYAKDCKNIAITGYGCIDGNEEIFYGKQTKWHIDGYYYPRVPLIYFENCHNFRIQNITLQRSGFWTTHLVGCENGLIEGIKILNNLRLANCDGIDPDHCKNIKIRNCYIESADDCIVFKTTSNAKKYGACENIEVFNCTLISTSAAIKFGTESVSDFNNITIHDCTILRSNRGISFQLRDEGNIKNVSFKNITIDTKRFSPIHWWGKAEPIAISAVKRKKNQAIGCIQFLSFENITMDSENGIFIYGDISKNIQNISFKNIKLTIKNKTAWEKGVYDLRPSEEYGILKDSLHIVYAQNVKNAKIEGFFYQIEDELKLEMKELWKIVNTDNFTIL